jgi:hypothetical protein
MNLNNLKESVRKSVEYFNKKLFGNQAIKFYELNEIFNTKENNFVSDYESRDFDNGSFIYKINLSFTIIGTVKSKSENEDDQVQLVKEISDKLKNLFIKTKDIIFINETLSKNIVFFLSFYFFFVEKHNYSCSKSEYLKFVRFVNYEINNLTLKNSDFEYEAVKILKKFKK